MFKIAGVFLFFKFLFLKKVGKHSSEILKVSLPTAVAQCSSGERSAGYLVERE